jgi:hypothetical protein
MFILKQFSNDAIEFLRNARTYHERLSVDLARNWLTRARSIRQQNALVVGSPGPFIHVLKQVPVDGF